MPWSGNPIPDLLFDFAEPLLVSMNIDYVIMLHNSRIKYVAELWDKLEEPKMVLDKGFFGVWGNAKRAWKKVDPTSDYGVVIQDDAILCDNFMAKAENFLTEHNGHVVSFYYGDNERAEIEVQPEYFDTWLSHAVALAIPTGEIPAMLEYCEQANEVEGDDMKMRRWLISENRICRYSNPSLVQHRDIPSIVNPAKPVRQSAIFRK